MNTTTASTTESLDLPAPRLAYDDTGDGTLALRHEFQPTGVYLDSATYGLAAQGGAPSALGGDCRLHS